MKALSIKQPWADLIVEGLKPIENRTWITFHRGPLLIHASKVFDTAGFCWPFNNWHKLGMPCAVGDILDAMNDGRAPYDQRGGIVGRVNLVDVVTSHPSPFFCGPKGYVLEKAERLPFRPLRGALGVFNAPDA